MMLALILAVVAGPHLAECGTHAVLHGASDKQGIILRAGKECNLVFGTKYAKPPFCISIADQQEWSFSYEISELGIQFRQSMANDPIRYKCREQ